MNDLLILVLELWVQNVDYVLLEWILLDERTCYGDQTLRTMLRFLDLKALTTNWQ